MLFPTMYLLHLHLGFRVALGFILLCRLTHLRMPDAVPVRKVSGLPRASFRFRLTTDTLAFGYALGATSCARDFHPLDHAHAGRTKERSPCFQELPHPSVFVWCFNRHPSTSLVQCIEAQSMMRNLHQLLRQSYSDAAYHHRYPD